MKFAGKRKMSRRQSINSLSPKCSHSSHHGDLLDVARSPADGTGVREAAGARRPICSAALLPDERLARASPIVRALLAAGGRHVRGALPQPRTTEPASAAGGRAGGAAFGRLPARYQGRGGVRSGDAMVQRGSDVQRRRCGRRRRGLRRGCGGWRGRRCMSGGVLLGRMP